MKLENPINKLLGSNIRKYRIRAGLSQAKLAKSIGMSSQMISRFENGLDRISGILLVEIAHTIGCVVTELFEGVDEHLPPSKVLNTCDFRMLNEYQQLSENIQASIASMVSAVFQETITCTRLS